MRVRDAGPQPANCRARDDRAIDWVGQLPSILDGSEIDVELKGAGLDQQAFCRALCRYAHYVEKEVPEDVLAPFKQKWLDRAATLLDLDSPSRWPAVQPDQRRRVLWEAREEVLSDYLQASKAAIVNYALLDGRCRERLDVPFVPSPPIEWGSVPFTVADVGTAGGPRKEWRAGIAASRSGILSRCVQNSRTALRLRMFWLQECDGMRLMLCPLRHAEPVDAFAFQSAQATQLDLASQQLNKLWLEVTKIISEEPLYLSASVRGALAPGGSVGKRRSLLHAEAALAAVPPKQLEEQFLKAVGAQLSLLLRSLVERSLAEYGDLFERYSEEPWHHESSQAKEESERQNPLIVNKLMLAQEQGGEPHVRFVHEPQKVTSKLLQPYRECARSLRGLPRPSSNSRDDPWRATLPVVREDEDHVRERFERIQGIVKKNVANAEQVLDRYQPFLFLLQEDAKVEEFLESRSKTRKDYADYVKHLRDTVATLQDRCPSRVHMQMMRVEAGEVNRRLIQCAEDCIRRLLSRATGRNKDHAAVLVKRFEALEARLSRTPTSEEQLADLEKSLEEAVQKELPALLEECEDVKAWLLLIYDLDHPLTSEDYIAVYRAMEWKDFGNFLAAREVTLAQERQRIEEKLGEYMRRISEDLVAVKARVAKFRDKASMRLVEDYLEQIASLEKHLGGSTQAVSEVHRREGLLGYDPSDFDDLTEAKTTLDTFKSLWVLARDQQKETAIWMKTPLFAKQLGFNVQAIEEQVSAMFDRAQNLKAYLEKENITRPGNVAKKLTMDLQLMKDNLPLLRAVCNPDLEDRHWEDIYNVLGFALERDNTMTLQKLLDMDFGSYISELCEVSEAATKEREVEAGLDAQVEDWASGALKFEDSPATGVAAISISSFEEVQALLDSHLVRTQALRRSPFAGFFRARMDNWERFLTEAQSAVHQWQKVQAVWLDLLPIMAEDVAGAEGEALPGSLEPQEQEVLLFEEATRIIQRRARDCRRGPSFLQAFREENLVRDLQAASASLDALRERLGSGSSAAPAA